MIAKGLHLQSHRLHMHYIVHKGYTLDWLSSSSFSTGPRVDLPFNHHRHPLPPFISHPSLMVDYSNSGCERRTPRLINPVANLLVDNYAHTKGALGSNQ